MKLEGYRTYITIGIAAAYWIAVKHGWMQRIPEIDATLAALVVAFLRMGSKSDAADAVDKINNPEPPELPENKP